MGKVYETTVFKTLKHTLWEMGNKWWALSPSGIPGHGAGSGNQDSLSHSPNGGDGTESSGRARWLELIKQNAGKERTALRSLEICREVPQEYSTAYWSALHVTKCIHGQGEDYPKWLEVHSAVIILVGIFGCVCIYISVEYMSRSGCVDGCVCVCSPNWHPDRW